METQHTKTYGMQQRELKRKVIAINAYIKKKEKIANT
jgi:hypothetical protein